MEETDPAPKSWSRMRETWVLCGHRGWADGKCFKIIFHRYVLAILFYNVQGVPKKTLVSVQRLLEALKSELQMKVG